MKYGEEKGRKENAQEENAQEENGRLQELLGAEGLEDFLATESIANDVKEYLQGGEEGSRKVRGSGWKRKAEEVQEQVQMIRLAATNTKKAFEEKNDRIKHIKEGIQHHKTALKELEEELAESQSQVDQLASILEHDILSRPQELMEVVCGFAEQESQLNEELTGLLESKAFPDLSSRDLAIVFWKMDLPHIHPIMEENEIAGKLLCCMDSRQMASMFQMTNQEAYTMQYHLELMQCPGYSVNETEETECPVCSHNTPQMTIELMKEHRIPIPPETIKKGRWTTAQIIYSNPGKDFQLSLADQISCTEPLSVLKKCHKEHLASLSQ